MRLALRIALPLVAPFAIVVCDPRWELVAVAAVWSLFILPGALVTAVLLPADHPLASAPACFATSTAAALAPFSVVAWIGSVCHWTLAPVLAIHGAVSAATVGALGVLAWRRRSPTAAPNPDDAAEPGEPRRTRLVVLVGLFAVVLVGFVCANQVTASRPFHRYRLTWMAGGRLDAIDGLWWVGAAIAIAAAIAAGILLARRRLLATPDARRARGQLALWAIAAVLLVLLMRVAYGMPSPRSPSRASWDPDDVSYVSQAVDAADGLPLARWEASLGGELDATRSATSIAGAPLVAALSEVTGVSPAALHHAVLPPLVILLGASALAAALAVVFRRDRWLVPLGVVVGLGVLAKSWDYPGSIAQLVVYQAAQPKALHLWFALPLQLATAALVLVRPDRTSVIAAIGAAIVATCIHPLAAIIGAVWAATLIVVAIGVRRPAIAAAAALLAAYAALGLETKHAMSQPRAHAPSTDRVPGEVRESRDLVRDGDRPQLRQDPRVLFGGESFFFLGILGAPIAIGLAKGRRRPELFYAGVLGVVGLAFCAWEPLGRVLGTALHPSIFWRARWLVPAPLLAGVLAAGGFLALRTLLRRALPAAVIATAALGAAVVADHSIAVRPGPQPARLDKLSPPVLPLAALLGRATDAPFVWAPRHLLLELPQAMPRIRLVYTLDKLMRPAPAPDFRKRVLALMDRFARDAWTADDLASLLALYPVDHVVVPARSARVAAVLAQAGWVRVGTAGPFVVWRAPAVVLS